MTSPIKSTSDDNVKSVTYVYDEELARATTCIPNIRNRSFVVHGLLEAYGLTDQMQCIPSQLATTADILSFHSESYLEFLLNEDKYNQHESDSELDLDPDLEKYDQQELEEYGLGYDCPLFKDMVLFAKRVAGGTLAAVDALLSGQQIVINWCGGWHHAQRDAASGFCYVNDIVIGIQRLQRKFKKILYIDLDAHHGDGVENAFSYSKKILTLSLHNYEQGYFPGTGSITDVGFGQGKYFTVNVPFKTGIDDQHYYEVFTRVLELTKGHFVPEAIVVQCGADSLAHDPLGSSNLTEKCLGNCVQKVLDLKVPTIFMGGGGYNIANSARCWAYLTSVICGVEISSDIPEHPFFPLYGSGFDLHVTPTLRRSENSTEYLSSVVIQIKENLEKIAS